MRARTLGTLATTWMIVAFATAEANAAPSKIVYTCAPNLCAVDPASGATATITTDGAGSAYRYPSISRDGRRVAAARGSGVVVGDYGRNLTEVWAGTRDMNDVAIAPDGSAVAESHSYVENRYGCPLTGGCLELVDRSATFFSRGADFGERSHPGGGGTGFLGAGTLLTSHYRIDEDVHIVCAVTTPEDGQSPCEPRVVSRDTLQQPDGSPDGRLIAAAVATAADNSALELFDAATGAPVRRLAPSGWSPSFSPDGRQVAFSGPGGWIYVVPTTGGRASRLVRGVSPSWGGGQGPGAALASRSLKLRKGRVPVKVRCGAGPACRGKLRIKKGRSTLGTRAYRVRPGRSATVAIRPTSRGRRTLDRARRHKITVQLDPRRGRTVSTRLTLRR